MQPTSNREKVAAKGVWIELGDTPASALHVNTAQGWFDIATNSSPSDPSREFLGGRVRVTAVPVSMSTGSIAMR